MLKVLIDNDLLVDPLPEMPRTTDSNHPLPLYRNLVKDLQENAPNEVWVSDITDLRTEEGFEYRCLIMDRYSRKILGWNCSENLAAEGAVNALKGALKGLPEEHKPIHHSDQGSQYCCHEYVYHLETRGLQVSMTEENRGYENAYAERFNGILKQEYGLRSTFRSRQHARKTVEQAIDLYSPSRPHASLGYRVPAEGHAHAA